MSLFPPLLCVMIEKTIYVPEDNLVEDACGDGASSAVPIGRHVGAGDCGLEGCDGPASQFQRLRHHAF